MERRDILPPLKGSPPEETEQEELAEEAEMRKETSHQSGGLL